MKNISLSLLNILSNLLFELKDLKNNELKDIIRYYNNLLKQKTKEYKKE